MAKIISEAAMRRVLARQPGIHRALGDTARRVQGNAERRLALHRQTGNAKVTLTEGKLDWFVNLEDIAVLSIEYGHWAKTRNGELIRGKDGKPIYVQGLYILSTAAGLV